MGGQLCLFLSFILSFVMQKATKYIVHTYLKYVIYTVCSLEIYSKNNLMYPHECIVPVNKVIPQMRFRCAVLKIVDEICTVVNYVRCDKQFNALSAL